MSNKNIAEEAIDRMLEAHGEYIHHHEHLMELKGRRRQTVGVKRAMSTVEGRLTAAKARVDRYKAVIIDLLTSKPITRDDMKIVSFQAQEAAYLSLKE